MRVRIYQPAKTAMQSGRNKDSWKVEFAERAPKFIDPLMGWVGMRDTKQQLNLTFDTKDAAIDYAEKHGLKYRVIEPKTRKIKPKAYADNFATNRVAD